MSSAYSYLDLASHVDLSRSVTEDTCPVNPVETNPLEPNHEPYESFYNDGNDQPFNFNIHTDGQAHLPLSLLHHTIGAPDLSVSLEAVSFYSETQNVVGQTRVFDSSLLCSEIVPNEWNQISNDLPKRPTHPEVLFDLEADSIGIFETLNAARKVSDLSSVISASAARRLTLHDTHVSQDYDRLESPGIPYHTEHVQSPRQIYLELFPSLNVVDSDNLGQFLVQVLQKCPTQVTLKNFYHLLYSAKFFEFISRSLDNTSLTIAWRLQLSSLKLCTLVLKTFRAPNYTAGEFSAGLINNSKLSSINTHELLRTFLAVKIILTSIEKSNDHYLSIPRLTIYKIYTIMCQELVSQNSANSNLFRAQQNIVLCQSGFGKIIKAVFPDLITKRLGPRGKSKYHLLGVKWKTSIHDTKLLRLVRLDLPEIKNHYVLAFEKIDQRRRKKTPAQHLPLKPKWSLKSEQDSSRSQSRRKSMRPMHSFVEASSIYPVLSCSPRLWRCVANTMPQNSRWADNILAKSIKALKDYEINIEPLVRHFSNKNFSDDAKDLFRKCLSKGINNRMEKKHTENIVSHLCLAISVKTFPMVVASDREILSKDKTALRDYLSFVSSSISFTSLKNLTPQETNAIKFAWIFKKMVHISELTMSKVDIHSLRRIISEIITHFELLDNTRDLPYEFKNSLADINVRSIFMSLKAYDIDLANMNNPEGSKKLVQTIHEISDRILSKCRGIKTRLLRIPHSMSCHDLKQSYYDLPFEMFRILAESFHLVCLLDPSGLQLPISVISHLILNVTNELQVLSFKSFTKRDSETSRKGFKIWLIFSTLLQEYIKVLSELVALSELL